MLKGEPATEQCLIVENVSFFNNADIDGKALPPAGAPNPMIAAGGTQLDKVLEASNVDVWQFKVDWKNPGEHEDYRTAEDHGRAVSLSLRRAAHQLRAAAGHGSTSRFAGRQDHVAGRLPQGRESRIGRRRALGQHARPAPAACAGMNS